MNGCSVADFREVGGEIESVCPAVSEDSVLDFRLINGRKEGVYVLFLDPSVVLLFQIIQLLVEPILKLN